MNEPPQLVKCERCKTDASEMVAIDNKVRSVLKDQKPELLDNLPGQVCRACYNKITSTVSKGAKLRIEQQAREKNKHMLWKSRVNLVKQARVHMQDKSYSEAAVTYEKYIRVLEIAYDLKPGTINPEVFGKSSKSKELTVIATAYWDLFRIYDTSPNYRDRMKHAADKLAAFLTYSPIYSDVIKRAQIFKDKAKNPDLVRYFLKKAKAKSGFCFVVTASFHYPEHPTVLFYRKYRDEVLSQSFTGKAFIRFYYLVSPVFAKIISNSTWLQSRCQKLLIQLQHKLDKKA